MSMGAEASVGSAGGAGLGAGAPNMSLASGGAGVGGSAFSTGATAPAGGLGAEATQPGLWQKLIAAIQNPDTAKAFSEGLKGFSTMQRGVQSMPPEHLGLVNEMMQHGQAQMAGEPRHDDMNPYGGDMMRYLSPDMIKETLDRMNIPYGSARR